MRTIRDMETIGLINYKVGDIVKEIYHSVGIMREEDKPVKGKVIYVHPMGRFYTVEFNFGGAKALESYTVRSDIHPVMLVR